MQQQRAGSIRGVIYDKDFDAPLGGAQVSIVETGASALSADQGNYVLKQVPPGRYTLVFSKAGYVRQVRADVTVAPGQLVDIDISLAGDFTEMDELVVQDLLQLGAGTEVALLQLRLESPSLIDAIGSQLMSRAGASDAASALRLVAGASVANGKTAVIRGLPDRYVSSQLNSVRLPSADSDKRAVELDQFPAAVIESIQVSKTFTPDQQGDASGGAVNVELRGVPEEAYMRVRGQYGYNSQTAGRRDFLTYEGGGVDAWGRDDTRRIQTENIGTNWDGAVGTSRGDAPVDYKWNFDGGGKMLIDDGVEIGGFASFFYERDSSFYDNGIDDSYWLTEPGGELVPRTRQGVPQPDQDPPGTLGDFFTALFDVTKATQSVQWGGVGAVGFKSENHEVSLSYLYSRTAQDSAILAIDTRGKEFFFPNYDPNDPAASGNLPDDIQAAPYLRTETLDYRERATGSLQLHGEHTLPTPEFGPESFRFLRPVFDWTLADSFADLDQPDKRQFGAQWRADSLSPGAPPFVPPFLTPGGWTRFLPAANFNLGNFQRIFQAIEEDSDQYTANAELPFTQWDGVQGYFKVGVFDDQVDRAFDQDSFSNFGDSGIAFGGDFDEPWSEVFGDELHPITESLQDVDYEGEIDISAWYYMLDLPLLSSLNFIGGARFESTDISITVDPEEDATWIPPLQVDEMGEPMPIVPTSLNPGDADVPFSQNDVLPSFSLVFTPVPELVVRAAYSETVARQTFRELTPVIQQEFLGGPIFIGNPLLEMSAVENQDLRADYTPYEGGLVSFSWFDKDIERPIEFVQRVALFDFTTPVNYESGELSGYEVEVRQDLGHLWEPATGFGFGANATFIDAEVVLPELEASLFDMAGIEFNSRDMTNAPEYLYNIFATYDSEETGTRAGLFYTVQGDTLVAGAGVQGGNFIPNIYTAEFDTLNFSLTQELGPFLRLRFQAKNLTNPRIKTVFRSDVTGPDVTNTSFTRGIDYSISLGARFSF